MGIRNRIGAGMVALALAFGAGTARAESVTVDASEVTSLAHQSPRAWRGPYALCRAPAFVPAGAPKAAYSAFCGCADMGPRLDGSMVRVCAGKVTATWMPTLATTKAAR